MEKKTIGQFIATLRKANGMTQRQLAEKLNVSDKAVSRWERDESAPDLTLIPVIAEIFNVTSDEILRGEKRNAESQLTPRAVEKSEKQLENLIGIVKFKTGIRGIIAIGIGIFGLIAAMICNFGFLRATLGFFVASIFFVAALICEISFGLKAIYSLSSSEFDDEIVSVTKKSIVSNMEKIIVTIVGMFAFTLPLLVYSVDTYVGLGASLWFVPGMVYAIIAVVLCIPMVLFIDGRTIDKYGLPIERLTIEKKINKKRKKFFTIAVSVVAITVFCHVVFNESVWSTDFVKGKTFYSVDDFVKYMETPYVNDESGLVIGDEWFGDSFTMEYYDELDDSYYDKEKLYGADGETVIAEYICRNKAVRTTHYEWDENNEFKSATVYTHADIRTGNSIINIINYVWMMVYVVQLVIVLAVYIRGNKKAKKVNNL